MRRRSRMPPHAAESTASSSCGPARTRRRSRPRAATARRSTWRRPARRPSTIADGLAAPFAGELPLEICRGRVDSVLVTDEEIADGMRFLYARAKLACEPAGAAAAAAVLAGKVERDGAIVAVVSGGNASP